MGLFAFLSLLGGCASAPPGVDTAVPDPSIASPTATFPSFYGRVPQNLLMVSVDTFRRDLLVRYGGEGHAAFLDAIAEEGVPLDAHRTCANWTFPSIQCAMQGVTNIEAGFVPDLRDPDQALMPETPPTLASRLAAQGYRTMLATSNSWFSSDHGSDAGFQYQDRPDERTTTSVFAAGYERLEEARQDGVDRWYLHIHVKEPHPAYAPPEEYLEGLEDLPPIAYDLEDSDSQYQAGNQWPEMTAEEQDALLQHLVLRYHGEVRWLSDQLTEQFAAYERAGFLDDTLVVFWTDHGEQFWEHGEQTHAYDLYAEENDAIALLWASNIVSDSWSEPTSHIDLAPTVLQLLDVPYDATISGVPVGEADPGRDLHQVAVARHGVLQSVVKDGWKLIYRWSSGERWLFDTVSDPAEQTNLYDPTEPHAVALEALLAPQVEALRPLVPSDTPY